jgi:glycosyltransferase involved in cell wall biosynthesis
MADRKPLDILLTTRATGEGGAERVWSTVAEGLAARGDRVTLAVDRSSPEAAAIPGVEIEEIGGGFVEGVARLVRVLRRRRPAIAMAATSGSCSKLVLAALLAGTGTPLVLSYHGFEEYKTGKLAAAAYWGLPLFGRIAARIVAVSDGLAEILVTRWRAPRAKTVRIYNPVAIDLAAARVGAADLSQRAPIVLAVGRLSPEKGMLDLVEAFALVDRPQARLVLLGGGPQQKALEALIAERGLAGRVDLVGWRADPTPWYRSARLVAIPSRTEAFGMVVVEALAHGLPVVSTRSGGPVEILDGGRWGRLVDIGDARAMAAAIEAGLDDPGDSEQRFARAAAFSADIGIARWATLVDEVVDEARARRGDRT